MNDLTSHRIVLWRPFWLLFASFIAGMVLMAALDHQERDAVPISRHISVGDISRRSPEEDESERLFRDLVKTHPHKEIRDDLYHLIRRGEIVPNYDDPPGDDLLGSAAAVTYVDTSKGEILMFVVSTREVLKSAVMSREVKQLIIYHEWIHVKQQREKRFPKWLLLARDGDAPVTDDELRLIFESEAEAYHEECKLAVVMQVAEQLNFCAAYVRQGLHGLRLAIVGNYAQTPFYRPHIPFLMSVANEKS